MPTKQDIDNQQQLLELYRRRAGHSLRAHAQFGAGYVPPHIAADIDDAHEQIRQIKAILRSWNIPVEDLPGDEPMNSASILAHKLESDKNDTTYLDSSEEHQKPTREAENILVHEVNIAELRKKIYQHFSKGDLRLLCFELHINHEDVVVGTLQESSLRLVEYCERQGLVAQLLGIVKQTRPHIDWQIVSIPINASKTSFEDLRTHNPHSEIPIQLSTPSVGTTSHDLRSRPTIGIITALPMEYAAVKSILAQAHEILVAGTGGGRRYILGKIAALHGGTHSIVLALTEMGNNIAAIRATLLLTHFPNVTSIVMAGIAGGVPNPQDASQHVRLGDIVVSDQHGIVQYDFDKESVTEVTHRHAPRAPSPMLLEAVRLLEVAELEGTCPWIDHINQIQRSLNVRRPGPETDLLFSSDDPPQKLRHPSAKGRGKQYQPRVIKGPIASANKLLKNPVKRDQLRNHFGVKAVEMEASGIADATWNYTAGYLVVRGICDYCDAHKNNVWQQYAAIVAAGYVRALIESMPVQMDAAHTDHPSE